MAKNINKELDWLEKRAEQIKKYVDDNPYDLVQDRVHRSMDRFGNEKITVIQKVEVTQKALRDSMKEYVEIIARIEILREEEKKKKEVSARGSTEMTPRMKRFTENG